MSWDIIEGNWKQLTGKVKEQWGKLTDDDLAQVNGNVSSWKARSRRSMATEKTRRRPKSTTGSRNISSFKMKVQACSAPLRGTPRSMDSYHEIRG
jgi:uncharacterized protein YjbJ (UPF0337 family)